MTNSHNKIMAGNNNNNSTNSCKGGGPGTNNTTERYFNNTSPPYLTGNGKKQGRTQRSPSTKCFNSKPSLSYGGGNGGALITPTKNISNVRITTPNNNRNGQHSNRSPSGPLTMSYNTLSSSPNVTGPCGSPPNFSHFAGSKCYDAPAPQTLPKPPRHWTSCASEVNASDKFKKFDIFSHNLKSILNVQA